MRRSVSKVLNKEAGRLYAQEKKGRNKLTFSEILRELKYIHVHKNDPMDRFDIDKVIEATKRKERRQKQRKKMRKKGLRRRNGGSWDWVRVV